MTKDDYERLELEQIFAPRLPPTDAEFVNDPTCCLDGVPFEFVQVEKQK